MGASTWATLDDVELVGTSTFELLGRPFVIVSRHDELIRRIDHEFVDLRRAPDERPRWEYRLERLGPEWLRHSWGLWRDGELLGDSIDEEYLPTFILGDVITITTDATPGLVGLRGSTLTRVDRTVLLVDAIDPTSNTAPPWWNEMALLAPMMTDGWSLVAAGSSLVETNDSEFGTVRACWRPLLRRQASSPEGPFTAVVTPASTFGDLSPRATLDAVFILRAQPGPDSHLEPLPPAAALCELATVLISSEHERGRDFVRLAPIVERLPAFVLHVGTDDLSGASDALSTAARSIT